MSNSSNIQKLMKYLRRVYACVPDLGIRPEFIDDDNHQVREVRHAVVALCMHLCPFNLSEKVIFQRDQSNEYLKNDDWCVSEDYQTVFPTAKNLVGSVELMNVKLFTPDKRFTQADKKEFVVRSVMIVTDEYLDFQFFKPFTREVRNLVGEGKFASDQKLIRDTKRLIESEHQLKEEEREFHNRDLYQKHSKTLGDVLNKYRTSENIKGTKANLMLKREQNILLKRESHKQTYDTFVSEWTPLIYMTFYILFIVGIAILVFHAYISIFSVAYLSGDMIAMFHYFANGDQIVALAALFSFTLLLFGFTY